ncbi:MAG: hypothetical protein OEW52_04375 [Thermoleophilia bacterium]|nr:hypothetical protein [Thermoleophilia bacterium]MDH4340979.1 hypothetical protein [Thermoleophilia bacterium]MDH5280370.1 hypothetical protein [Thermoleophilia bacterium]
MPRKHTFAIVVLLVAGLAAGALALTRTTDLGSSAGAPTGPDASIVFRLKKLDRLEASLERKLAERADARPVQQQITVYRRAPAAPTGSAPEREDAYEAEGSDDGGRDD